MNRREVEFANTPMRFESVTQFLNRDVLRSGAVEIQHGGLPIHFFWDNRGADTTFVTFSGAVSASVKAVPAWAALATTRDLGVNRLLISDPTIILDADLRLAWNAGSRWQPRLQHDLTSIIQSLAKGSRLILFGPSGGGFAALEQATRLPGSTVIASNPQTDVRLYIREAVERYLRTAWAIDALDVEAPAPFQASVVESFSRPVDTRVVYLQNAGDIEHVEYHYLPFRRSCHVENKVAYMLPDLGPGHVGPDRDSFVRLFETVRDHRGWDELVTALAGIRMPSVSAAR